MSCRPPHVHCVVQGVRYVVPAFSCHVVPGGGHLDLLALVTLGDVAPGPRPLGSCQDSFVIVVVVDGGCLSLWGSLAGVINDGWWQVSCGGAMVRKCGVGLELGGSWGERGMDPLTWRSEGLEVLWVGTSMDWPEPRFNRLFDCRLLDGSNHVELRMNRGLSIDLRYI